ncbi:MAG: DUF2231 domain-containing protein [Abditibacteriaceae bacterium]
MIRELFRIFGSPGFDLIDVHMGFVHLPIGLLWGSAAFDFAAFLLPKFFKRHRLLRASWHSTGYWLLMMGAVATIVAATLGYFGNPFAGKNDILGQRATIHMYFGFTTVGIFCILALWRIYLKNKFTRWEAVGYSALLLVGFIVITVTGFLGSHVAG